MTRPRPEPLDGELVGDLALPVQLGNRDDLLVRRDLEHAVGRRVDDRRPGLRMCSAPSRSMISVPDATTLPSTRRPIRRSNSAMSDAGKPSGKDRERPVDARAPSTPSGRSPSPCPASAPPSGRSEAAGAGSGGEPAQRHDAVEARAPPKRRQVQAHPARRCCRACCSPGRRSRRRRAARPRRRCRSR